MNLSTLDKFFTLTKRQYIRMKQKTIQERIQLKGKGLHTGQEITITLCPAEPNYGIRFQRIDLDDKAVIKADTKAIFSTKRCTTIGHSAAQIHTIEHLLSALRGLGIDNILVEVDGEEIPIMDGSAAAFVEAIQNAGILEQDAEKEYLTIDEAWVYNDEETGAEYVIMPSETPEYTAMIDFGTKVLGKQYATFTANDDYAQQVSSARTFVFLKEVMALSNAGLIQGGTLDNALVFVDEIPNQETLQQLAEQLNHPYMEVTNEGILNTTNLRYDNEPARHKLLDLIGDLALVGAEIKGKIIATRPGHAANARLAKKLHKKLAEQRKKKDVPRYDPSQKPIYDINDITKLLQHRFPFLLIDKIIEMSDTHVVGVKNVTMNEPFFTGHFPGNPVMPGVLQIEAMAQTGGILVMGTVDDPKKWDTYFLNIKNARFRDKVLPGDTLVFKSELIRPIRRGLCEVRARAFVGDKLVSEAELLAQIIKRK